MANEVNKEKLYGFSEIQKSMGVCQHLLKEVTIPRVFCVLAPLDVVL